MPFSYHPPTRNYCEVCQSLVGHLEPIIETSSGKASSADSFPFHNWYNFVLGYTPQFPDYIIKREGLGRSHFVVDPFFGSGTTMICCKLKGIESAGVEANDFFWFAAKVKLNWELDIERVKNDWIMLSKEIQGRFSKYEWREDNLQTEFLVEQGGNLSLDDYVRKRRPKMLLEKYISNVPFAKLSLIKDVLSDYPWENQDIMNLFYLGYAATILPASNVRYGPGFGVIKPRTDIDVFSIFRKKVERMVADLESVRNMNKFPKTQLYLGDVRTLGKYFEKNSVDVMITSPPYPGDHEYTKHSRLELILADFAQTRDEFRKIKQRMLRSSTTNIYKTDHEGDLVKEMESITSVVRKIDRRLMTDGATSGFEKLYSKLVWEYFGGMYKVFVEAIKVLKPGGRFVLLVSDSHAFKMVHIETAKLLQEVAEKAGFYKGHVELWQYKNSTSHKYRLLENILTVEKPLSEASKNRSIESACPR